MTPNRAGSTWAEDGAHGLDKKPGDSAVLPASVIHSHAQIRSGMGGASVEEYEDKTLVCVDCNEEFTFTSGEQLFFADKGLKNAPKRCKSCKQRKNERIAANGQSFGAGAVRMRVEVSVNCALCAVETTVPFRPTQGRPVYCRDCFLKMRASVVPPALPLH